MGCISGTTFSPLGNMPQSMLPKGNLTPLGQTCAFQFPVGVVLIFLLSKFHNMAQDCFVKNFINRINGSEV